MPVLKKPNNVNTISTYLTINDASKAIDFYKKVFDAQELRRMTWPHCEKLMHAQLRIGDSSLFLADELPETGAKSPEALGGTASTIWAYVDDADAVFRKAIENGAKAKMTMMDAFWGDRYGQFVDPFGHTWAISTHVEDVTDAEMKKRQEQFFKKDFAAAKS